MEALILRRHLIDLVSLDSGSSDRDRSEGVLMPNAKYLPPLRPPASSRSIATLSRTRELLAALCRNRWLRTQPKLGKF